MWRCDPNRSGSTAEALPDELHLQWVLRRPALAPAWPEEPRMRFDEVYQPIVVGQTMFVGSSHDDSVSAYAVADGSLRWRFYADGPVRFAPAAWGGMLFVASDDGWLYCLDAATGKPRWKHRGGPGDRKVLGNERLISAWPARGGPVIRDGVVYYAAGIWPFMGVFLYALDASTGQVIWCNDSSGEIYMRQPHDSPAFAGVAPQGYLAATADCLLVPNGRAVAAAFDRRTGKLSYFRHAEGKKYGHSEVAAAGKYFINAGHVNDLLTGEMLANLAPDGERVGLRDFQSAQVYFDELADEPIAALGEVGILAGGVSYLSCGDRILARDVRIAPVTWNKRDSKGQKKKDELALRPIWEVPTRARPMAVAGGRLYAADKREIVAFELPAADLLPDMPEDPDEEIVVENEDMLAAPKQCWRAPAEGTPAAMVAAAGRLFVVTREGGIYCYGETPVPRPPVVGELARGAAAGPATAEIGPEAAGTQPAGPESPPARLARQVLHAGGVADGYCLVLGIQDGSPAEQIALQSNLRVIALDADAGKVDAFRRRIDRSALGGGRLAAMAGEPATADISPYLASLIVWQNPPVTAGATTAPATTAPSASSSGLRPEIRRMFQVLRPYGGVMCLSIPPDRRAAFAEDVASAGLAGAQVRQDGDWTLLSRTGPLPGAGQWTGQYGDPANTCLSLDALVKAPLGLLWFGGHSTEDVLPRHGHGPPEQVVGGRLFMEGADAIRATDVYTGRLLWQVNLIDVGANFDNTEHMPGANGLGSNFAATADTVYVIHANRCVRLDAATGRTLGDFRLPPRESADSDPAHAPPWGFLAVWQDVLVAGASPVKYWSPDLLVMDFARYTRDKKQQLIRRYATRELQELADAIGQWSDFALERPRLGIDPPPASQPTQGVEGRPAELVDFVVANVNKMIRQADVMSKLPEGLLAELRKKEAKELATWDQQRRLDDFQPKPRPETIDDLAAWIEELRTTGRGELEDGRTIMMLKRQVLEHCYRDLPKIRRPRVGQNTLDNTSSTDLFVLDRHTGKVLWHRQAEAGFRHNAICIGGGKLFCIDRLPGPVAERMLRRGIQAELSGRLLAMDAGTGRELWSADRDVFGTTLSYSRDNDVLLEAGRANRDSLGDEIGDRMVAFRGESGNVLWDHGAGFAGPCMIRGKTIITQGQAFDLLTGMRKIRPHPLTGEPIKWGWRRNYGCNTAIGSTNLLTFRSAAAGFYDLERDGGTGNLGGFKSGCTSNLIAADGVLNAPDYTRTCTCSYQNQSSLALIHMPQADMWTFQDFQDCNSPVTRMGINFGAPGDRLADNGTLWIEYPFVGGPTPKIEIEATLDGQEWDQVSNLFGRRPKEYCFRRHPSAIRGAGLNWVAASGIEAAGEIRIRLSGKSPPTARAYTVSLHFVEPGPAGKGQRVFDVALQGQTVLKDFDIVAQAGAALTPVVRTFQGVSVNGVLRIALEPSGGSQEFKPILCGAEIVAE